MKRKRTLYVSSAAAVVLLVGGPVAAAAASAAGAAATAPAVSTAARADVDALGAAEAAVKHYPGVVESLDLDGSTWHVDVIGKNGKHAELEVDAAGGSVTRQNDDDDHYDGTEYRYLVDAEYTAQQAIKAALAAHPGKVVSVEWDDDDDNGTARYWNVEVKSADGTGGGDGKTQNVHVDPTTGKATLSDSDSGNDGEDGQDGQDGEDGQDGGPAGT